MALTTYGKLAEIIRDTYYRGKSSDDANYSVRYFAEQIAMEVAEMATINAFQNSNAGETAYANDTFTSTFTNIPVLTDAVRLERYSVLPQMPAALPNNQEITNITPLGVKGGKKQVVPMKGKDKFMQDILGAPKGFILYYIQDGKIFYDCVEEYMFTAVNITMIGAISTTGNLVDAPLNIPKNFEGKIMDKILSRLLPAKMIPQDNLNDGISNPA